MSMTGPAAPLPNSPPASAGEIVNTDVGEQVVDVGVALICSWPPRARRRSPAGNRPLPPDAERRATRAAAYRRAPAHQLHTVVVHRYGWRSLHRRPRRGGSVAGANLFGAGHTDNQHVDARVL